MQNPLGSWLVLVHVDTNNQLHNLISWQHGRKAKQTEQMDPANTADTHHKTIMNRVTEVAAQTQIPPIALCPKSKTLCQIHTWLPSKLLGNTLEHPWTLVSSKHHERHTALAVRERFTNWHQSLTSNDNRQWTIADSFLRMRKYWVSGGDCKQNDAQHGDICHDPDFPSLQLHLFWNKMLYIKEMKYIPSWWLCDDWQKLAEAAKTLAQNFEVSWVAVKLEFLCKSMPLIHYLHNSEILTFKTARHVCVIVLDADTIHNRLHAYHNQS